MITVGERQYLTLLEDLTGRYDQTQAMGKKTKKIEWKPETRYDVELTPETVQMTEHKRLVNGLSHCDNGGRNSFSFIRCLRNVAIATIVGSVSFPPKKLIHIDLGKVMMINGN